MKKRYIHKKFQKMLYDIVKSVFWILSGISTLTGCKCSVEKTEKADSEYNLNIHDLRVRDPFIFANIPDSTYYLHANSGHESIICYASKDLQMWKLCGESFCPPPDFWGKRDFWAPDLYFYRGKYYMIATFGADEGKRGVGILVSDRPDKGFVPLSDGSVTRPDWMCLDGSLYVDKEGNLWLVYCREWIEVSDGEIYAQRLSDDLSGMTGDPICLFKGSAADWPGLITSGAKTGIVTNSPFIYTSEDGQLLMTWSSFLKNGEYAIGMAVSSSGNILGPWVNCPRSLNDDGGHAMIFYDFNGQMLMSYHTNELPERIVLRPIHVEESKIMFLN